MTRTDRAVSSFDRRLRALGEKTERATGLPAFVSLATIVAFAGLLVGLFALYADIAVHIDYGRDPEGLKGLFSPSHTLGIFALTVMFVGAFIAMYLYPQDLGTGLSFFGRRLPYGATYAVLAGCFTMLGFPFDFTWHFLFGEDVTLWGPSHMQLIGGGGLTVLGFVMLSLEARGMPGWRPTIAGKAVMMSGILASPTVVTVFAAEVDFGIPQFQAVYMPLMVAAMAAMTLVFARMLLGRGGALAAAVLLVVLRGTVFVAIAALDIAEPRFFPYILEALIVEAVFLLMPRTRPVLTAATCGLLIGTLGVVGTFAFSQLWGYTPAVWSTLPRAMALSTLAAIGCALLAVGVVKALAADLLPVRGPRIGTVAAGIAMVALAVVIALPRGGQKPYVADVDVHPAGAGKVIVDLRFDDPEIVRGADWFDQFVYQGGYRILEPMRYIGDGTYRTPVPIPVTGNEWKSMIRIADGSSLRAIPIRYPADPLFTGAPAINPVDRRDVAFGRDQRYLLREVSDTKSMVMQAGYAVHGLTWILFLALTAWMLRQMYDPRPAAARVAQRAARDRERRTWPRAAAPTPA